MTEEREWIKRIQEENAHLKNQIRVLRENYELRTLLDQQCENNSQAQFSAPQISPSYPDTGSLVKTAQSIRKDYNYSPHIISKETAKSCPSTQAQIKLFHTDPVAVQSRSGEKKSTHISNISCPIVVGKQLEEPTDVSMLRKSWLKDGPFPGGDKVQAFPFRRLLNSKEMLSCSPSWPEESRTLKTHREDAQAQIAFSDDVNIHKGGISERQPYCFGGSAQDFSLDKTQPESQKMPRKKRVWFSDLPATDKLRKFHTFYLNDLEIAQNNKKNGRIVGEIAFQLDRRILAHVFPGITRLYGFTVSNIPEKIKQVSMKSLDGSLDEKKYRAMTQRYRDLIARLEKMGYCTEVHPVFSEFLINTYGILKQRPDLGSSPMNNSPNDLRKMVIDIVPAKFLGDTLLLLNCLCELSKEDNKALFAW
ncbi:speriolin-like protein [Python bivittatus]|uniref:Speriolin-like protein n=1 Tax=Python bivittatus TaxID=176946 RepID=A0A9F5MXV8_PYTBI|nr:speriolin-like protein [Python bivittatus]